MASKFKWFINCRTRLQSSQLILAVLLHLYHNLYITVTLISHNLLRNSTGTDKCAHFKKYKQKGNHKFSVPSPVICT